MKEEILANISEAVIEGSVKQVASLVNEALTHSVPAGRILNEGLIAGMNEVGALFKDGEMFVPEVLVAAKAMQGGIDLIRNLLVKEGVDTKGKIMTVTVEGDLHDIGVKLVGMMLEGAGFDVINIGVDMPAAKIIEKVKECRPDILGMSAMLTTTMTRMKDVIDALKEEGLLDSIKVMVGGAPVSPMYAEKIGAIYSENASAAVAVAKQLLNVA
ncbi:MAG: corrinoid protein [Synergistes jonesii]|uniref:cobalamin B12-binding domain-containing protein n=1 Tax=Synergistes jonesii TaxID=2754 RepID=UPI002A74899D|nr:corrinoid protein [Synergistes jonesii]MDY2984912.1 corrinoid protein [Synergistes jonesii]